MFGYVSGKLKYDGQQWLLPAHEYYGLYEGIPTNKYNNRNNPRQTMNSLRFEPNEVVWAKVTGYPWWPAQVATSMEGESPKYRNKVKVFFFGDNSHAYLSTQKLAKYQEHYSQFNRKSLTNRKLKDSIEMADLCCNGYSNRHTDDNASQGLIDESVDDKTHLMPQKTHVESVSHLAVIINREIDLREQTETMIIQEDNVVELLEQGIVKKLIEACQTSSKVIEFKKRLLDSVLKKYKLNDDKITQPPAETEETSQEVEEQSGISNKNVGRRHLGKGKFRKIQKKALQTVWTVDMQKRCILKLYAALKQRGFERSKARLMSSNILKSIRQRAGGCSTHFRRSYRETMIRLHMGQPFDQEDIHECILRICQSHDKLEEESRTTRQSDHQCCEIYQGGV